MDLNDVARERCETLLRLARENWKEKPERARRYVRLAKKIAERHRIRLGNGRYCKKCFAPFVPGETLRVRLSPSKKTVLYICSSCNNTRRIPYFAKKQRRKQKASSQKVIS